MKDKLYIFITASPIPSHPDTRIIDEVISSVYNYPELKDCNVHILHDGVRPEQSHLKENYREYRHRLYLKWPNIIDSTFPTPVHQAAMLRSALYSNINTPYILFMEHDTPLIGDIPWEDLLGDPMKDFHQIRLYPEAEIQVQHMHLMRNTYEYYGGKIKILRTNQYSARPHIARKDWYSYVLNEYFSKKARTYIEDRLYSMILRNAEHHCLGIYTPEGNIRRSGHNNGRESEPKFDQTLVF